MDNRSAAAAVSLLVSQAILLLFSLPTAAVASVPRNPGPALLLLLHLISSSEIAASIPLLLPRRRKRPRHAVEETPAPPVAAAPLSILRREPDPFRVGLGMSAPSFEWLSGLLEPLLDAGSAAPRSLPAAARLALGLSRLSTGAPYADLASRFGVTVVAARACVRRLRRVLCTNFRFWLAFPSHGADLLAVSAAFVALVPGGGIPGCCGAVACARFGGGGVAAQVLADASCRILGIAAGFRGDLSDSKILRRSSLYRDGEAGRLLSSPEQYVVGGGAYPLLPWLMVPFESAAAMVDSVKGNYNILHKLMLRPVRRTVASLRHWGVLGCPEQGEEEEDGRAVAACIATCAILHNVMLMREDYSALASEEEGGGESCSMEGPGHQDGAMLWELQEKAVALRATLAEKAREVRLMSAGWEET